MAKLAARVREKGLELVLTDEAKDFLIERGTAEKFGARPLRRAIEQYVEDALSEKILRNEFEGQNRVVVSVKEPPTEDDLPVLFFEGAIAPDKQEQGETVAAAESADAT